MGGWDWVWISGISEVSFTQRSRQMIRSVAGSNSRPKCGIHPGRIRCNVWERIQTRWILFSVQDYWIRSRWIPRPWLNSVKLVPFYSVDLMDQISGQNFRCPEAHPGSISPDRRIYFMLMARVLLFMYIRSCDCKNPVITLKNAYNIKIHVL